MDDDALFLHPLNEAIANRRPGETRVIRKGGVRSGGEGPAVARHVTAGNDWHSTGERLLVLGLRTGDVQAGDVVAVLLCPRRAELTAAAADPQVVVHVAHARDRQQFALDERDRAALAGAQVAKQREQAA